MAKELDDLELWLPSEFLTDDDLLTDFKTDSFGSNTRDDFLNGYGASFGFSSGLSSPVPSPTGSTETESDEDDFISDLTRKVARSTLRNSSCSSENTTEGWKLPSSPQSTLCGCKPVPGGDPNSISRVCWRQDAKDVQRLDLLYAAAEEAARMRMIKETAAFYSTKLFGQQPRPSPVTKSQQNPNQIPNFYRNQAQPPTHHTYHQLQAACFQQMKKQQLMKNGGVLGVGMMEYQIGRRNGGGGRAQGQSVSGWPSLQRQHHPPGLGSGMRAVILGETGQKKERIGTGVFMPRRFGSNSNTSEARKKSGCSTVLLPDKVVQALNLNLDPIETRVRVQPQPQPRLHGHFFADHDGAALKQRNIVMLRRSGGPPHQEVGLPQEWTY